MTLSPESPATGESGKSDLTRRTVLRRAAAVSVLAIPAVGLLDACAGSSDKKDTSGGTKSAERLTTYGGDEDIRRALSAGAKSYLTKDVLHDELLGAIRAVNAGETYLPANIKATLDSKKLHPDLSTRELEVLELIVQGLSNKQLAYHLKIAEDTAKNHVKSILKKLGADDRTQAATRAIQRGIVHLD